MLRKHTPYTLTLRGQLFEIGRPLVMGIVNVTPDSFYGGSRCPSAEEALGQASRMIGEGADILDIGASSSRPGSAPASEKEEWQRLEPVLDSIRSRFPDAILSVDTFRSSIARRCIEDYGVNIINDISGCADEGMPALIADSKAAYVLMHIRGTQQDMQCHAEYGDVTAEVLSELAFKVSSLRDAGVSNLIVDPGFGFAKTLDQNYRLMADLDIFHTLEAPLLVGISRKSMVSRVLEAEPDDALAGTIALNTVALGKGADILRVHDVKETVDTVKIISKLWSISE